MAPQITGQVQLNPSCMGPESTGSINRQRTMAVVSILNIVFPRLGHRVSVWVTQGITAAWSDDKTHEGFTRSTREIKHICNIVFEAFYAENYDMDGTLRLLEDYGIIPVK